MASDKNDLGGAEEKSLLGLGDNPVSLYYSDKITEWDHTYIDPSIKTLIANNLPTKGPYTWNIKDLVPGVF